jgi:hypothetical protein
VLVEESNVQVIEAPLAKKRKLRKGAEPTVPATKPAALVIEPSAPTVKATGVADFLAARRHQAPPPSVPRVKDVAAFLANEPVLAIPVNMVGLVEKPLQAPKGLTPSMLDYPLGSNIQDILEDLDMGSEDSVGIVDDNLRPSTAAAAKTPRKTLSPILEAEASSRAPTSKRP